MEQFVAPFLVQGFGVAPTVPPKTFRVNFGTTEPSTGWNNLTNAAANANLINLKDTTGANGTYHIYLVHAFTSTNNAGQTPSPAGSGIFPDLVHEGQFFSNTAARQFKFTNLNPGKTYTVRLFGSRKDSSNRPTTWTIDGVSKTLECGSNINNTIEFNVISPSGGNEIIITTDPGAGSGNGFSYTGAALLIEEN
jgi:hypothetical protein